MPDKGFTSSDNHCIGVRSRVGGCGTGWCDVLEVVLEPLTCLRLLVAASGAGHSLARTRAPRIGPVEPELWLAMERDVE